MSVQQKIVDIFKKLKSQTGKSFWENFFSAFKWYFIVVIFLEVFVIVLWKGFALNKNLENPLWAGAIALLIILPPFIPSLIEFFRTRLSGITIPGVVQITLKDIQVKGTDSMDLAEKLNKNWKIFSDQRDCRMEYSDLREIDTKIAQLQNEREKLFTNFPDVIENFEKENQEFIIVDLKNKDAWIAPNLYYLALLLEEESFVNQIVFLATRTKDKEFIGMCFPGEILERLDHNGKFLHFKCAAEKIPRKGRNIDLSSSAKIFFQTLWDQGDRDFYSSWLDSQEIHNLVCLQHQHIEFKEKFTEQDYKQMLYNPYPYTAIIKEGQFDTLVKRDKVAYAVARSVL